MKYTMTKFTDNSNKNAKIHGKKTIPNERSKIKDELSKIITFKCFFFFWLKFVHFTFFSLFSLLSARLQIRKWNDRARCMSYCAHQAYSEMIDSDAKRWQIQVALTQFERVNFRCWKLKFIVLPMLKRVLSWDFLFCIYSIILYFQ